MRKQLRYDGIVRSLTLFTLTTFLLYGLMITVLPLFPFWIDEWLLLDNLKFKTAAQLWHTLAHTQQFPRVYLEIIKSFAGNFDYSYCSLRLPSFLAHSGGIFLCYRLSERIFRGDNLSRFLWLMLYVSFNSSIHYFVQLKQYTMEMALSLVAIWQLLDLLKLRSHPVSGRCSLALCLSFAVCPFFSYTYPIVIAPIYALSLGWSIRNRSWPRRIWMPLSIGVTAIAFFYWLDVRHVLADPGMQDFWQDLLMKHFSFPKLFVNTYLMFSTLGSGDLFGNIFGVLGIVTFFYSSYSIVKVGFIAQNENGLLLQYSCLLIWIVIGLFIAGKLPLGTFRLNSFAVPAIGLMIVKMLSGISASRALRNCAVGVSILLFLGAIGNVFVTMAELTTSEHAKKLRIYRTSELALIEARQKHLPILVTSGIAYPFNDRWPGDWILKTLPAYKIDDPVAVFALSGTDSIKSYARRLPALTTVIILDGETSKIVHF